MASRSKPKSKTNTRRLSAKRKGFFSPPFSLRAKLLIVGLAMIPAAFSLRYALALPEPSFRPVCYVTKQAPDDPIVFPGQPGKSHMHIFFGSHTVDANATTATLLADPSAQCGAHFTMDRSAYWVPMLYKNGQQVYTTDGSIQVAAYYKRAGGPGGKLIDQPFPQGLRIIAGNPSATSAQDNVWFKCANTVDTGSQSKYGHEFPSCSSNETLIAEVQFPDCWNGTTLDSPDHKSHMTFSGGANATCPASHPVKVPKAILEVWYFRVNGPASSFSYASGGAYSFHADIFSAWDPRVFAGLVNYCLNFVSGPVDCNPRMFEDIDVSSATQAQIDQQLAPGRAGQAAVPTAPATVNAFNQHLQHNPAASGSGASRGAATATPATPAPAATPAAPTPAPAATPSAQDTATHEHSAEQHAQTPPPTTTKGAARFAKAATHPLVLLTTVITALLLVSTFLYIYRGRISWWLANIYARISR